MSRPFTAFLLMMLMALAALPAHAMDFSLSGVHAGIQDNHPTLRHVTAGELAEALQTQDKAIMFDVRERGEFAVSHLKGAIQIDPDIATPEFITKYAAKARGKMAVFYCSVGVRSSNLAERVREHLMLKGAAGVYNLQGGIFNWHNEERPLVDRQGATDFVHPYNSRWGRLVTRADMLRYKPEKK